MRKILKVMLPYFHIEILEFIEFGKCFKEFKSFIRIILNPKLFIPFNILDAFSRKKTKQNKQH